MCGLSEKIDSLDKGVYTNITREFDDGGTDLSIGEIQKIALARAFIRNAPIVILDERTSALDPISECNMYENYLKICDKKTGVFISHRLSCAPLMDKIIVIKDGAVLEEGTHDELLSKKGLYCNMFAMQGKSYLESSKESGQA